MCGICGKLNFDSKLPVDPGTIRAMSHAIAHRGPDDEGHYVSGPIGFGFRRLSIIDLKTGHQPISNEDATIWLEFNGEIYNYQDLRKELVAKGHIFRTQTDTEVIVHLYEDLGEQMVERLRGMFAIALWDSRRKTLLLVRDRLGIKPLYYGLTPGSIVFGSEIKAILADPSVDRELAPTIIDRFLSFYYTPGEQTPFKHIQKLAAGHYLTVKNGQVKISQYWDLHFSAASDRLDLKKAEQELVDLLDEAVRLHMISDVPVGFLLSGGIDSTAMLSFATGKTDRPITSYTVGFSGRGIEDERPYARLAARWYGVQYHDMTITAQDFVDFLPRYVWHMEEMVCEPPAVALFFVSRVAKQHVKVLISGEGGDEAFAGYGNYRNLLWLESFKRVAGPLKGFVVDLHRILQLNIGRKYMLLMNTPFSSYYHTRTSNPFTLFNRSSNPVYSTRFAKTVDKDQSLAAVRRYSQNGVGQDQLGKMLYVDTKTWLPDDLLVKADKITMANSIELRVPFLDHKVMEFSASLPSDFKVRGTATKYIAKRALRGRVPREILRRKKVGFPVPYDSWLRKDLRSWTRDLLLSQRATERGYFDRRGVENLLSENESTGRYSKEVFCLAVVELWHRVFTESSLPAN